MAALAGRRIVVTRRGGQSASLARLLQELGATVIEVPAIEIVPARDPAPLDAALRALPEYDWVVFTSANAVEAIARRLDALGLAARLGDAGVPKVASVGRATTAALTAAFPSDAITLEPASEYGAAGLLEAFAGISVGDARVLLPASSRARDELVAGLRARGARVDVVVAYETVEPPDLRPRVEACLEAGFDLLAFASPSAVESFAGAAGERGRSLPVVAIGPTTANAAAAAGFDVKGVASPSTVEGLVDAAGRALGSPSALTASD